MIFSYEGSDDQKGPNNVEHISRPTPPHRPAGLSAANRPASLLLADGDTVELGSAPVARRLPGTTVWMPAYNGSTRVPFSRSSRVRRYRSTSPTTATPRRTVHWHGLRLDNPFDDVPHETQASIPIDGRLHPSPQVSGAGLYAAVTAVVVSGNRWSTTCCWRRQSGPWSRCCSTGRSVGGASHARSGLSTGHGDGHRRSRDAVVCRRVRRAANKLGARGRADRMTPALAAEPDKTLALVAEMDMDAPQWSVSTPDARRRSRAAAAGRTTASSGSPTRCQPGRGSGLG